MKASLFTVCPLLAIVLASCASQQADVNNTPDPYGAADAGYADTAPVDAVNPVYDTPAAYEEGAASTTPAQNDLPAYGSPTPSRPAASAASAAVATPRSHKVMRGDTLWGLSKKYNVPVASIKQANNMTSDVLVLDRSVVIPAQ